MIEVWRHRREGTGPISAVEDELDAHMAAVEKLLEKLGHRPFGRLELRMPGNAFDCQVIFRWERDERASTKNQKWERDQ